MIVIIHGDDTSNSRNLYFEYKQKFPSHVTYSGNELGLSDLLQAFEGGGGLFGSDKYVFIEDFFSSRKHSKDMDGIIEYLNTNSDSSSVIFWEGKEITQKTLSLLPKAEIKIFKLPKDLFLFLDSIRPKNIESFKIFVNLNKTLEEELIFFMLIRQFRLLIAVSSPTPDPIDEVKRLAPWQLNKLLKQAGMFSTSDLVSKYIRLSDIDYGIKTGTLKLNLKQAIDLFLLNL